MKPEHPELPEESDGRQYAEYNLDLNGKSLKMPDEPESNGLGEQPDVAITEEQPRKRAPYKRKPWVYTSEHERIISFWKRQVWGWMFIALVGWLAFIISMVIR